MLHPPSSKNSVKEDKRLEHLAIPLSPLLNFFFVRASVRMIEVPFLQPPAEWNKLCTPPPSMLMACNIARKVSEGGLGGWKMMTSFGLASYTHQGGVQHLFHPPSENLLQPCADAFVCPCAMTFVVLLNMESKGNA